jgi:hypothetical protein
MRSKTLLEWAYIAQWADQMALFKRLGFKQLNFWSLLDGRTDLKLN